MGGMSRDGHAENQDIIRKHEMTDGRASLVLIDIENCLQHKNKNRSIRNDRRQSKGQNAKRLTRAKPKTTTESRKQVNVESSIGRIHEGR